MNTLYNIRYSVIFFIFTSFYVAVLANLYFIQIHKSYFFSSLANQQHNIAITTTPFRAEIKDRNNKFLALNKESYAAFIIPTDLKEPQKTLAFLRENYPKSYERFINNKPSCFMYIKRRLTNKEIKSIKENNIVDVKFLKEPSRFYTVNSLGPLIGITDIDNKGILGLELQYDKQLSGKPTTYILEKDARSGLFYFKKTTKVLGVKGSSLTTTIDGDLQFLVYEELKSHITSLNAQEGSVIIMDPNSGDILSLAVYPDFDPQNTVNIDITKTKNKIACDAYELGSVIKVFLGLAALEENIVKIDDVIDCENTRSTKLNGQKVNTWKAHNKLTFSEVIQYSNNIGTAKLALKLGPKLYDHYKKVGFGIKNNLFLGENAGFITPPEKWSKKSPISLSFGYEISATLLQLARAFSIIANNGYTVKPQIIKTNTKNKNLEQLYSEESITAIKEILRKTITKGTAQKAHIRGYTVMGKTGTANLLENGTYNKNKNIYTFAGIIEKDNYKRVIVTSVKEVPRKNVYASTVSAPLFEKIAQRMLIHNKII